jgi:hypothetical protein
MPLLVKLFFGVFVLKEIYLAEAMLDPGLRGEWLLDIAFL